MNPKEEEESTGETARTEAGTRRTRAPSRLPRVPLLALLLAALVLAPFAATVLSLRSFGDEVSGTGADHRLRVPRGGVEVDSEAGDVEVSGLPGAVTVRAEAATLPSAARAAT